MGMQERYTGMSDHNPIDSSRQEATGIINALRRGTVPALGLQRIAVGLAMEEEVIRGQLDLVACGNADIKYVRGEYGSGKTFFIARTLEIARKKNFITSRIRITQGSPLHKMRAIYSQIISHATLGDENHAAKTIIDLWLYAIEEKIVANDPAIDDRELQKRTLSEIEHALVAIGKITPTIGAVIRTYYIAHNAGDFMTAQSAIGWLCGEETIGREMKKKAGIRGDIDDSLALPFLQAFLAIITGAGFRGLAIAIDETEIVQTMPRNLREKGYNNLVGIIDAIDGGELPNCYILCTGTPALFEGPKGFRSLPQLIDRIKIPPQDAMYPNPRQPQLILRPFDAKKLEQVAHKVIEVYQAAYGEIDRERVSHRFIRSMVLSVTSSFGGRVDVIPRIFLKELVDILDKCELYPDYDPADQYTCNPESLKESLNDEEIAAIQISF